MLDGSVALYPSLAKFLHNKDIKSNAVIKVHVTTNQLITVNDSEQSESKGFNGAIATDTEENWHRQLNK